MDNKSIILALIEQGNIVAITPKGESMLPTLNGKSDKVEVIKVVHPLKKGDLALYRDPSGELVLHRVIKVDKTAKTYQMRGDGNVRLEEPLPFENVFAKGIFILKKGKRISVKNPIYILKYVRVQRWRNKQEKNLK